MEFNQSETCKNLAASFAGECQAGMRYQLIARDALSQGYKTLSDEIRHIAKNETYHAKVFFDYILQNCGNTKNIEITNGFPFEGDTIENGLKFATDAENKESKLIYPQYAEIAKREGYDEIADTFLKVAEVEEHHKIMFEYLYKNFKDGSLFKNSQPVVYECSNCGYRFTAEQAFSICPLCKSSQGFVKLRLP